VQVGPVSANLIRLLGAAAPDLAKLLQSGQLLEATVLSVHQDRAVLVFGRGVRLEVGLQAPLTEGDRIQVQVQATEHLEQAPDLILKIISREPAAAAPISAQAPNQAQTPQIMWLPIPLANGEQGWVQIHVEQEAKKAGRQSDDPGHQVRLWWQTPTLGAIQVTLDSSRGGLASIFTVQQPESKQRVDEQLPHLRERLVAVGFPDARVGARQAAPSETIEPVRIEGLYRVDRQM
jgi:hypothetical protein